MSFQALSISVPGSIMITGEHAVVYGHPAIVCAVEQRVTVHFTPRSDRFVHVNSEICAPQIMSIDEAEAVGPLKYVFGAIALYRDQLETGFDIVITSHINPTLGLGSSAAVTIAILAGLMAYSSNFPLSQIPNGDHLLSKIDQGTLHNQALRLVRSVQGRGSGADLAASLHGGMIAYQLPSAMLSGSEYDIKTQARIEKLPSPPQMSLCYCGYKTPTGEVLAKIADKMRGNEAAFQKLYSEMGRVASSTIEAVKNKDWQQFFSNINDYQELMIALGVSDTTLDKLITQARSFKNVHCAKISGSGLGDCILAFGDTPDHHMSVKLAQHGLHYKILTECGRKGRDKENV